MAQNKHKLAMIALPPDLELFAGAVTPRPLSTQKA
jgi:hypothetical protein